MRLTHQPRTAGERQGNPVRLDFAEHRGAECAFCMGLMFIFLAPPPPPAGAGVRIRAGGRMSWVAQCRVLGRTQRHTIGDVRKVNLAAARSAAEKHFAGVALGGDPAATKAEAKAQAALSGPMRRWRCILASLRPEVGRSGNGVSTISAGAWRPTWPSSASSLGSWTPSSITVAATRAASRASTTSALRGAGSRRDAFVGGSPSIDY